MKTLDRYLGSVTYAANQQRTLQLPRNYAYSNISLLIIAQLDRAATSADGGTCKDSAPAQLVRDIEVLANGKNTIKKIDFEGCHRLNQMRHMTRPQIYAHDWLGYADKTNSVMKVMCQLDFELPKNGPWMINIDTLLDSAGLATLDLNITFGAGIDTMNDAWPGTGSAETVTVDSAVVHVWSKERVGVPAGSTFAVWKEWKRKYSVTSAGLFTIDLPVQTSYLQIGIKTHSDGDQVDTIIPFGLANTNNIRLYSGTETFLQVPAGLLQSSNRMTTQMEVPERIGSGAALNHAQQELLLEGWYLLDFCHDGRLTEALDARNLSDLKLELDLANPGTDDNVEIYISELLLPPAPKSAVPAVG